MPNICDDLRAAILQAAMQGKLTKQLSEDGDAEDLLEEIKAEKEKLIAEGKIKKQKPLAPMTDDEIPFSIPENWRWVRLGDFSINIFSGKSPKYNKTENSLYILGQKNNQESGINLNGLKYSTQDFWNTIDEWQFLKVNDVLLNTLGGGTVGRSGIFDLTDGKYVTDGHLFVFRPFNPTSAKFLLFFLKSIKSEIEKNADGSTNQVFLKLGQVNNWVIPLPPLTEQKRIVEKVNELMDRVADLEQSADALASLKKAFPDDIKASLLQAAMQGKLTKQLSEDGDAEDLLEEIKAEKEKLIAEGKIKKQKALAPITDDEIPFSIPKNWKWVRLEGIAYLTSGTQYEESSDGVPYLKVADMNLVSNTDEIITSSRFTRSGQPGIIPRNSIIFPKRGGAIATNKKKPVMKCPVYVDSNTMGMTAINKDTYEWLKLWFDSIDMASLQTGTSVPQINNKDIYPLLVPIPPVQEQRRIIERLDALMQNINVVGDLIASE